MHKRRVMATQLINAGIREHMTKPIIVAILVKEMTVPYEVAELYFEIEDKLRTNSTIPSDHIRERLIARFNELNMSRHPAKVTHIKKPRKPKNNNQLAIFESD